MATNDDRDERLYGFVRWIAKAGKEQALRDELLKLVPNARRDPGNISYDLFTPVDQPAMTYRSSWRLTDVSGTPIDLVCRRSIIGLA